MTPLAAIARIKLAISTLEANRDYPVPRRVGNSLVRWAKRSGEDARAAHLLVAMTSPEAFDAQLEILREALSIWKHSETAGMPEIAHALRLANAALGVES